MEQPGQSDLYRDQTHKTQASNQRNDHASSLPDTVPSVNLSSARVIFLQGGPSIGKTTLAQHLARDLNMVHLQPDNLIRDLSRLNTASAFDDLRTAKDRKGQIPEFMALLLLKMEIQNELEDGRRVFLMESFPKTVEQFYDFERQFGYQFTLRLEATSARMAHRFHNNPGTKDWEEIQRESTAFLERDREFQQCSRFWSKVMRVEADHAFKNYYPQIRRVVQIYLKARKVEPEPWGRSHLYLL